MSKRPVKIWQGNQCVYLKEPDGSEPRMFVAKGSEGDSYYVRELHPDGSSSQPCEYLADRGSTLMSNGDELLKTIRREYQRARRLAARQNLK